MKKQDIIENCIDVLKKIKNNIPEIVFLYDLDNVISDFFDAEFYLNDKKYTLKKITNIKEIETKSVVIFFDAKMVFAVLNENMIIVYEDARQYRDVFAINKELCDKMIKSIEKTLYVDNINDTPDRKSWESPYGPPKKRKKRF